MRNSPRSTSASASRRRAGFTLIELLVSVVIIGVLASFAILGFTNTKGKASMAAMKSDLRNLAQVQEGYFAQNSTYTNDLVVLLAPRSPGVALTIVEADSSGWSATTRHPNAPNVTCALYYGAAAQLAPATAEGSIRCQ